MHCIVMTWHWTNCRSYYHHFMTRWMCITWKHNCIACAWWTHDLYQQQSTWWAMKQELSEKFVFVIKEKKTSYSDGVNCFFIWESNGQTVQQVEIPQKTDFTVACSIYSFMVFRLISYSIHNSTKLTKSWFVCNWCFYDGRSSFYDWKIFYEGPTVCCYIYNLKQ